MSDIKGLGWISLCLIRLRLAWVRDSNIRITWRYRVSGDIGQDSLGSIPYGVSCDRIGR